MGIPFRRPDDLTDLLVELPHTNIQNLAQNLVFGLKMVIDTSGFYAGYLRNVAHRRGVVAFVPEQASGRNEDTASCPLRLAHFIVGSLDGISISHHSLSILNSHNTVHCNKSNNC